MPPRQVGMKIGKLDLEGRQSITFSFLPTSHLDSNRLSLVIKHCSYPEVFLIRPYCSYFEAFVSTLHS
jgi:hypothetical protein